MVSKTLTIKNPTGLHLRPAGILCELANSFDCKVYFKVGDAEDLFNAKSILCVLGAGVKCGDDITVVCDGTDEEKAIETLSTSIEAGLQ